MSKCLIGKKVPISGSFSPKIIQCTKGDTTAATVDAAVDETAVFAPWKSLAPPIIKRPTMIVIIQTISREK